MNDSISTAMNDSIVTALENIHTPASYYQQAFCQYNKGDSTAVETKLLEISSEFDLSDYENNIHNEFGDFFDILISLLAQSKSISQMDSVKQTEIEGIMDNSNDLLRTYCRNILITTAGLQYNEPYLFPDTSSVKSSAANPSLPDYGVINNANHILKLYPNPATEYLVMEYFLPYKSVSAIATVTNTSGLNIENLLINPSGNQKILDLRKYKPGTYLIRLISGGKVLETKKFVKH